MTFHIPEILLEDVWFQNFAWPKDVQTHGTQEEHKVILSYRKRLILDF